MRQRSRHKDVARSLQLYETVPVATKALLKHQELPHGIWEPHCGKGALAEVLFDTGHAVYCSDIVDRGYPHQQATGNFLKSTRCPAGVDGIVMNPPFAQAALHVRHALQLCPFVVALLPLAFLEAGNEKTESGRARLWCLDKGHLKLVLVFRDRLPMMHRDGWDGPKASSNVPYAWFVFDGDHQGLASIKRISWRGMSQD
jgi:hypothetical protein